MPLQEEVEEQYERLTRYRRTLAHYLRQKADLGESQIPPGVSNGITETRENIRHIKNTLRSWNVAVDDHPDDDRGNNRKEVLPFETTNGIRKYGNRTQVLILGTIVVLLLALVVGLFYNSTIQQNQIAAKATEVESVKITQTALVTEQQLALAQLQPTIGALQTRVATLPITVTQIIQETPEPNTNIMPIESMLTSVYPYTFTKSINPSNFYSRFTLAKDENGNIIYEMHYSVPEPSSNYTAGLAFYNGNFADLREFNFIELTISFEGVLQKCKLGVQDTDGVDITSISGTNDMQALKIPLHTKFTNTNFRNVNAVLFVVGGDIGSGSGVIRISNLRFTKQ